MATQNSTHVSDELLAELQSKAAAEGKTVDELAEEALRKGLEERAWQELVAYGRERGRLAGFTEEQSAHSREERPKGRGRLWPGARAAGGVYRGTIRGYRP